MQSSDSGTAPVFTVASDMGQETLKSSNAEWPLGIYSELPGLLPVWSQVLQLVLRLPPSCPGQLLGHVAYSTQKDIVTSPALGPVNLLEKDTCRTTHLIFIVSDSLESPN